MTKRSILGFGKYNELTVGDVIQQGHSFELIKAYYKLEKVNFTDDILNELFITPERRIEKPGKSQEAYNRYAKDIVADLRSGENEKEKMGLSAMVKKAQRKYSDATQAVWNSKQRNKNRVQRLGVKSQ